MLQSNSKASQTAQCFSGIDKATLIAMAKHKLVPYSELTGKEHTYTHHLHARHHSRHHPRHHIWARHLHVLHAHGAAWPRATLVHALRLSPHVLRWHVWPPAWSHVSTCQIDMHVFRAHPRFNSKTHSVGRHFTWHVRALLLHKQHLTAATPMLHSTFCVMFGAAPKHFIKTAQLHG